MSVSYQCMRCVKADASCADRSPGQHTQFELACQGHLIQVQASASGRQPALGQGASACTAARRRLPASMHTWAASLGSMPAILHCLALSVQAQD